MMIATLRTATRMTSSLLRRLNRRNRVRREVAHGLPRVPPRRRSERVTLKDHRRENPLESPTSKFEVLPQLYQLYNESFFCFVLFTGLPVGLTHLSPKPPEVGAHELVAEEGNR